MSLNDPQEYEPRLATRRTVNDPDEVPFHPHHPSAVAASLPVDTRPIPPKPRRRWGRALGIAAASLLGLIFIAGACGFLLARHWVRTTVSESLPQIDGSLALAGLSSPVSVQRDAHGVPHIHASTLDDLVFAQGFVTAQDRLFQMDTLRRYSSGELAEILGSRLIPHDKLQRTLQIRASADRAIAVLPPDQLHLLEAYAKGVNASMEQQAGHLSIEFRVLQYKPAPWTPRDSLLVSMAMFQDLTNTYPAKLAREALTVQLPPELVQDLYPTGSWRDHPPSHPQPDLTVPGPPIEQVPLDESQASLALPARAEADTCEACVPGSNNWVVSGAHTASGKPLLSNDMHLATSLPGIWYETDLEAPIAGQPELHVAGVTIPGLPLIVVGHNAHLAWGFTNLGADVQDVYIETTRGSGDSEEFQTAAGDWQPVMHIGETIKVKHGRNISLDVLATKHGDAVTPILTPTIKGETRQLSLRWTLYDPSVIQVPVLALATSHDWTSFLAAFSQFGGPAQNVVYTDDQGHIGYHAVGRVPLRGAAPTHLPVPFATGSADAVAVAKDQIRTDSGVPNAFSTDTPEHSQLSGPLSPVPLVPSPAHEWSGYIPFDQLPQVYDPPGGIIATANANVTPPDYPYPITLNWAAPYRNERIWHLLEHRNGLKATDMLTIQTDIYSDFDDVLAQRLAYAIDHSDALKSNTYKPSQAARLHQAADLLRNWNGRVTVDSSAAAIVANVHAALWPMLLKPHLQGHDPTELYAWYSKDYALEQLLQHTPPRWLPKEFKSWDDLLTAAVAHGIDDNAPSDLTKWRYGTSHTLDIEHPIFDQSAALKSLLGKPTGTGPQQQSGDGTTIKQVGHTFGPSERFTADLANLDASTLNLVLGQSGNPNSPWFMDQFQAWYHGTTFAFPFSDPAVTLATSHTLTLTPR